MRCYEEVGCALEVEVRYGGVDVASQLEHTNAGNHVS
jgi:hypothetical protein